MIALAALALASSFDLKCVTETLSIQGGPPRQTDGSFGPVFKINLAAKRYCAGSCNETKPIARVTETVIYLDDLDTPERTVKTHLNRESGAYLSIIRFGKTPPLISTATCEPRPFTGFPARKF